MKKGSQGISCNFGIPNRSKPKVSSQTDTRCALGLALSVAVASKYPNIEASLQAQVTAPHFAAVVAHVKRLIATPRASSSSSRHRGNEKEEDRGVDGMRSGERAKKRRMRTSSSTRGCV